MSQQAGHKTAARRGRALPSIWSAWEGFFDGPPKPLRFDVRQDEWTHDVAILGGLVHDADVRPTDVTLSRRRLVIPLLRECWEYGTTPVPGGGALELHNARSQIVVWPVSSVLWHFDHKHVSDGLPESMLNSIWLQRPAELGVDAYALVLDGLTWRLIARFAEGRTRIVLRDLEKPYLWSQRHQRVPAPKPK